MKKNVEGDSRVLIINADNLGQDRKTTDAIVKCYNGNLCIYSRSGSKRNSSY